MRDAFGGVFMIRFLLVFLFIFVAFSAIQLNYAKAFKLKNKVIDFVETNEVIDLNSTYFKQKLDTELKQILEEANYNKKCNNGNGQIISEEGFTSGYCYNGIVIIQKEIPQPHPGTTSKIINYQIETYVDWNLGILNRVLALGGQKENSQSYVTGGWKIVGEAKVVARDVIK